MSEQKDHYMQIGKYILTFYMIIMSVGLSMYMLCGCTSINKKFGLKDDNIIESLSEDVIKYKTGIDIDLTPGNPDEDNYRFDVWRKD